MALPRLKELFKNGTAAVVEKVGDAVDKIFSNKEEMGEIANKASQIKLEVEKEVNRHMEALEANVLKEYELEVKDRDSARTRETEFVKATGHIDYLMWFLVVSAMVIFGAMIYFVFNNKIPEAHEGLIHNIFGIIEGVLLSIFSYYFGSSVGSRVKDMKPLK